MQQICAYFGISRQAHYQKRLRQRERRGEEPLILEMVRQVRRRHPRMGARKLLNRIAPMLAAEGLSIGRDRLFDLLREENLLVPPKKAYQATTRAGRLRAPNRLSGLIVSHPNQVWVCDITYLNLQGARFGYLFVIMDLYSRYVVGWHVSSSLAAEEAVKALEMALARTAEIPSGLIHHSDHGTQYTSHDYMQELSDHEMLASMGAVGNCYDNAFAERLIGILKDEYLLDTPFATIQQMASAVEEVIHLYNTDRPHLSLDMAVPIAVHNGQCLTMEIPKVQFPAEEVVMT